MKKLFWAIPSFVLFLTPWVHRLAYENIRIAVPDLSSADAHAWALGLSALGFAVLFYAFIAMVSNPRDRY